MRILYWILNRLYKSEFEGIDIEMMNDWLFTQSVSLGFKSYFKYRDLAILKELGKGVKQSEYWKLVGQRHELLLLVGKINDIKRLRDNDKKYVKNGISNKDAKRN